MKTPSVGIPTLWREVLVRMQDAFQIQRIYVHDGGNLGGSLVND